MCNIFDIFIAFAGRFNNCCTDSFWGFFARHADYVLKLEENLEDLKNVIGELRALKNDVMRRVEVAEQQQMKQLEKVGFWFDRVDAAIEEGDALLKGGIQEVRRLCLGGYCSVNCWSTSNFGKRVDKCLKHLAALKDKGEQFGAVAEEAPAELVAELPCDATIGTEAMFNEVWSCLQEKNIGVIGIYGIGGVGKTTLLTQIRNKFVDCCDDFLVIWIVVGKNSNSEEIHAEIAREIGVSQGSTHVYNKLLKKKFVLLLDDIWERVKLEKIGIPSLEKLNGSKIIFTTRSLKICGEMRAQKKIRVETLEWEHAWELFKKYVGDDTIIEDPAILPLAESVAERCGGLPIALITIGRAMCCKMEAQEWRHAVEVLKEPALHLQNSNAEVLNELEVEVFSLLKFSFDSLPNDEVKSCFLYCCLYPEDRHIEKDVLIDYWICEDMWIDRHKIMTHREGYSIIGTLVRSCLLEEEGDYVKLHDVIRDMALWIERENALVMANMKLTEPPAVGRWEGLRRLSLMENKIKKLTQVPTCPKLVTLLLNDNEALDEINEDFFQSMSALSVLDLSNSSLETLPRSVVNLTSLQYLDISSTEITELPVEFAKLDKLKHLGLRSLHLKVKKSEKIISCLSSLQILRMSNCVYSYQDVDETKEEEEEETDDEEEETEEEEEEEETEEEEEEEEEKAVLDKISVDGEMLLEELLSLKHLNSLGVTIRCFSILKRFFSNHMLMSVTNSVWLRDFKGVKSLNIFWLSNLKYLAKLTITKCCFEDIYLDSTAMEGTQALGSPQLKDISFNCLRRVALQGCDHLRDLTWLIWVPNLSILGVYKCYKLEEVISGGKLMENDDIRCQNLKPFSKLDLLELDDLPELKCIYPYPLPFLLLTTMNITNCPLLKKLPLDANSKEGCKIRLDAEEEWWEAIEWQDSATKAALLPRFKCNLY